YVRTNHDIRERTDAYQDFFAQYQHLKRPRTRPGALPYGSRLDRPLPPQSGCPPCPLRDPPGQGQACVRRSWILDCALFKPPVGTFRRRMAAPKYTYRGWGRGWGPQGTQVWW